MRWGEKVNFVGNFTLILFFLFSLFFLGFIRYRLKLLRVLLRE